MYWIYPKRGKEAAQHFNIYSHIMYTTKEQGEKLNVQYPEFYLQAANIAENFGIIPQQVRKWIIVYQ